MSRSMGEGGGGGGRDVDTSVLDAAPQVLFTETQATALMEILMTRGYFHQNADPVLASVDMSRNDPLPNFPKQSCQVLQVYEKQFHTNDTLDVSSSLSSPSSSLSYATLSYLQEQLKGFVQDKGLCTRAQAAEALGLWDSLSDLARLIDHSTDGSALTSNWIFIPSRQSPKEDRIVTATYLDSVIIPQVVEQLICHPNADGVVAVSTLAQQYQFTTDQCRTLFTPRLLQYRHHLQQQQPPSKILERRNDKGIYVYVTTTYLNRLQAQVQSALLASTQSIVHIPTLCQQHGWEQSWVWQFLQDKLEITKNNNNDNTSSSNNNNSNDNTNNDASSSPWVPGILRGQNYIPDLYRQTQKQTILEMYTTNGYVTTNLSATVNMLPLQLKEVLQAEFPHCIVLSDSVIDYNVLGVPLEALLQEASETFCELHLDADLMNFPNDIQTFVQQHVMIHAAVSGTVTVTSERVLFVSDAMLQDIQTSVMEPQLESMVHACMEELTQSNNFQGDVAGYLDDHATSVGWDPDQIGQALLSKFPNLQVLQHDGNDQILHYFVVTHLLTDAWRSLCIEKMEKVWQDYETRKSRTRTTMTTPSLTAVVVAFEDPSCFATACHVIQMQNKFLEYAVKVQMTNADVLEKEILHGPCRDLVRRLTLYLLDKYNDEESVVTFVADDQEEDKASSLSYCTPVDTALRRYPIFRVQCTPDSNGKERDLAQALTDAIPLQVGKSLAELDEATTLSDFLQLAEENCLTICGIPFRKLDKKSEKSFLSNRRQRLLEHLQTCRDARGVLEYTIMLLYQSVKHFTVCGSHLTGSILQQLVLERKVPGTVSEILVSLAASLNQDDTESTAVDDSLLERVRACGLAKDIAKHVV